MSSWYVGRREGGESNPTKEQNRASKSHLPLWSETRRGWLSKVELAKVPNMPLITEDGTMC